MSVHLTLSVHKGLEISMSVHLTLSVPEGLMSVQLTLSVPKGLPCRYIHFTFFRTGGIAV